MATYRQVIALLLLMSLSAGVSKAGQDKASVNAGAKPGNQDLEVAIHGEVILSGGRRGMFRIYETPDGTRGAITYGQFQTTRDANRQVKDWLRLANKITSRQKKRDSKGRVIGERILATRQGSKPGTQEFLVIIRSGFDCYFITSYSLPVAMQLEELVQE